MTTEQLIEQIQNGEYVIPTVSEQDWSNDQTIQDWKAVLETKQTELEGLAELPDLPAGTSCKIACLVQYVICMQNASHWGDQVTCQLNRDICLENCGNPE